MKLKVISFLVFSAAFFLLTGCSTGAERHERRTHQLISEAYRSTSECVANAVQTPEFQTIRAKIGNTNSMPLDRLADRSRPTRSEIDDFVIFQNKIRECDEASFFQFGQIAPLIADAHRKYADARAQDNLAFIQNRLTWGEFNQRRVTTFREFLLALRQAEGQTNRQLRAASEEARRGLEKATDDLARWGQDFSASLERRQPVHRSGFNSSRRSGEVCFGAGERVSGFNKICFYNCVTGQITLNLGATDLCPLTTER
jgi:hypothetical protein